MSSPFSPINYAIWLTYWVGDFFISTRLGTKVAYWYVAHCPYSCSDYDMAMAGKITACLIYVWIGMPALVVIMLAMRENYLEQQEKSQ